ncbi:MAG: universal stress protein [Anaerolineales bacterium]
MSVIRPGDVPLPETVNRGSLEYWRWSLAEKLSIASMALEGRGLRALTRVAYGNPVEQIVGVAEEERVEMIVIGAQGATAAQELLSAAPRCQYCWKSSRLSANWGMWNAVRCVNTLLSGPCTLLIFSNRCRCPSGD